MFLIQLGFPTLISRVLSANLANSEGAFKWHPDALMPLEAAKEDAKSSSSSKVQSCAVQDRSHYLNMVI